MNAKPKPLAEFAGISDSLRDLIARFGNLVALESKAAGLSVAWMFGFVVITAFLIMTGVMAMLACLALMLVQNGILGWVGVLTLASLISFSAVAILLRVIVRWRRHSFFPGTRRQFVGLDDQIEEVIEPSRSLQLAEQKVAAAKSTLIDEFHSAQAGLRHRVESPIFLGAVFLGAIGVGYLTAKSGKPLGILWRGGFMALQTVLPIWLAKKMTTTGSSPPQHCRH